MHIRTPALICAVRPHGETAVIARLLTADHGLVAGYVAGGRGRQLRPVLIPGNVVDAEIDARSPNRLAWARVELMQSRGPWLSEPLPAAAIGWTTVLPAAVLPERHPYPAIYDAALALLDAICLAPSARGWIGPLAGFERLVLRELGYGGQAVRPETDNWAGLMAAFDRSGVQIERYLLADRGAADKGADVMTARALLRERLRRMTGENWGQT
ncbi:MAG: recombination protein O N-terminal domain-containing protein [Novosphingobium sp.]|nr:recombination protein O N-terminal domain-containing protein [Novosphingobium sp.]